MTEASPRTQAATKEVFELEETVSGWDEDFYQPIAERYYDRAVPDMLTAMGAGPAARVLDAGCGPGVHSIRAARHGCEVVGIDRSETMLTHARARAVKAGMADRITFQPDDLTDLQITEHFDHVFSWGVVIHIPNTDAALDQLAGAVAPGGHLALHVLNARSLDFRIEKLARRLTGKWFPRAEETDLGFGVWYERDGETLWVLRFDAAKLAAAMERRGLERVSLRGAEFTEFQWRLSGWIRRLLLRFNSFAYGARLTPGLSCTQIHIFRKRA
ncbi:MAG: class I SAM-dependent methyltransferase [Pseudomonadota bacterium]